MKTALQVKQAIHGFTITHIDAVPDVRGVAIQAVHEKSGARLLHLLADDPENLFAVALRTPPPDNTGLPHILEHTVLCGSRKYPVKDPFVELLKTSLASFLNAMTYPDKTVYPCASMNEKDFFNIADVYCDAVFHPNISEMHFKQEGHHFDFKTPGDTESELIIKGIVYNEMKGAYSDLDGVIDREESRRICPDNAYGVDSGGDPHCIPELTYQQFTDFHARYYHPSNALIFVYGGIDTEQHLAFLNDKYLAEFDRIDIDTSIATQPRWTAPIHETIPYPVGPEEDVAQKTAITLTWLCCDSTDALTVLAMNVLEHYLLDNAASPLRKALIDSQLGAELTNAGYADFQRDTFFTVGLKGSEPEQAEALTQLVLDTLKRELEGGLDKAKIDAAFHRLEISAREIGARYPLRLMDRVYRSWLYDDDPARHLRLHSCLQELHRSADEDPRFFESILRSCVLDNPHYAVLTFVPDAQFNAEQDAAFAEKMAGIKAKMDAARLQQIAEEATALESMQNSPNSAVDLATLPKLSISDVPPEPQPLDTETRTVSGQPLLVSDVFAGGLNYVELAFDLTGLDVALWPYVSIFASAMTQLGAAGEDYIALAGQEAACCAGIHASADSFGLVDDPAAVRPWLMLGTRGLDNRLPEMLDVLRKRILATDFTDRKRLRDVLRQGSVRLHSGVIPQGNQYASLQASRSLNANSYLKSLFGGFELIRLVDQLAANFETEADALIQKFEQIRTALLCKARVHASVIASPALLPTIETWYGGLLDNMSGTMGTADWPALPPKPTAAEGIATAADVAFVASAFPAVAYNHPNAPVLTVLSLNLSYGYLWNEVRAKRGAYGCRAGYSPLHGLFQFASYRDPCIAETLITYDSVCAHVLDASWSAGDVEQAVIGAIKSLDVPMRPGHAVRTALLRHLTDSSYEVRAAFRKQLLRMTPDDITRTVKETLQGQIATAPVCILSSRQKLSLVPALPGGRTLTIEDL